MVTLPQLYTGFSCGEVIRAALAEAAKAVVRVTVRKTTIRYRAERDIVDICCSSSPCVRLADLFLVSMNIPANCFKVLNRFNALRAWNFLESKGTAGNR